MQRSRNVPKHIVTTPGGVQTNSHGKILDMVGYRRIVWDLADGNVELRHAGKVVDIIAEQAGRGWSRVNVLYHIEQ